MKRTWLAALAVAFMVGLPLAALASDNSSDDMVVFGGQHEVIREGQEVYGDLIVIGGSADVEGRVDGDAVALGGRIFVAPRGHVNGSLINLGGSIDNESNEPQTQPSFPGPRAVVPVPTPVPPPPVPYPESSPWYAQGWTTFFFIDALLAFVAFLLFPARTRSASEHLLENPVLAGMLGFFSPIIFVLVVIALAITLIGIPLIPLAVIAAIAGYLIGKAAIAEFIGNRLFDVSKAAQPKPIAAVAIGLGLLLLVEVVASWLGIVFYFCVAALALGASLYMLMRTAQAHRSEGKAFYGWQFPATTQPSQPTQPTQSGPPQNPPSA
jgi:hypothetical protein